MAIHSGSSNQVFEKHNWSSNDEAVRAWVGDIIWKIMGGPYPSIETPSLNGLPAEAAHVLREVIVSNSLEGMTLLVYGDALKPVLGAEFYTKLEHARRRTELFLQEVHWLLGPKLAEQTMVVDDYAVRPYHAHLGALPGAFNPRFISTLTLWTPTLAARQDVIKVLEEGGFHREMGTEERGYIFEKGTEGIAHRIWVRGTLWDATKNWVLDLEREVWDRSLQLSTTVPLKLEATDLFLFTARRYAIDTLMGSAGVILDLVNIVEQAGDDIDWNRLRKIKNSFHKPEWMWAPFHALGHVEQRLGRQFELPDWARDHLRDPGDTFIADFLASRLVWANPDAKLIEFPRAWVKVAKGT